MVLPPTARRCAFASLLAWCVVVLVTLGQLNALGHGVLVQHTVCAEHGDVHHGEDNGEAAGNVVEATAETALTGSDPSVVNHDHCDGWARLREQFVVAQADALPLFEWAHLAIAAQSGARTAVVGIPLLATAPKLPPPAA